jgi:cell division protein FtsB
MSERHRHPEYASRHELAELRREVQQLRAEVRELAEQLRVMSVLQTAARTLLGLPPTPDDK